jgi:hypothetical protein
MRYPNVDGEPRADISVHVQSARNVYDYELLFWSVTYDEFFLHSFAPRLPNLEKTTTTPTTTMLSSGSIGNLPFDYNFSFRYSPPPFLSIATPRWLCGQTLDAVDNNEMQTQLHHLHSLPLPWCCCSSVCIRGCQRVSLPTITSPIFCALNTDAPMF